MLYIHRCCNVVNCKPRSSSTESAAFKENGTFGPFKIQIFPPTPPHYRRFSGASPRTPDAWGRKSLGRQCQLFIYMQCQLFIYMQCQLFIYMQCIVTSYNILTTSDQNTDQMRFIFLSSWIRLDRSEHNFTIIHQQCKDPQGKYGSSLHPAVSNSFISSFHLPHQSSWSYTSFT